MDQQLTASEIAAQQPLQRMMIIDAMVTVLLDRIFAMVRSLI